MTDTHLERAFKFGVLLALGFVILAVVLQSFVPNAVEGLFWAVAVAAMSLAVLALRELKRRRLIYGNDDNN